MNFSLEAACGCDIGKIRKNNEDNFFFDNRCLEEINVGLKHVVYYEKALKHEELLAVFDGMGGENYGEVASYAAANCMKNYRRKLLDYFVPEKKFLQNLCLKMNEAVLEKQKELYTERMGTTVVAFYFTYCKVYVCNLGDSRAYRLRDGVFQQLSKDHILHDGTQKKKAPLTQHLGISPEDFIIEPFIAKGDLKSGDNYLLCSDGLTDMLSNLEVEQILSSGQSVDMCVQQLIDGAKKRGGKDNITVIICRIK